ncbi:MAG: AAA family ATPase, partial [Planctomycetia bacterium]
MLKSLEIFGFKSFAERTRFEFDGGVTAVVGPNGSGKSNVVDALRWILGEQSAKSLRGQEMTDVIFNGSTTRRSLGLCEVSLTVDNRRSFLPIESDEVVLTRRLYRTGEGEYLINGKLARLRDIRELFLGTGAAAYSIIAQGKVELLLQ